MVKREIEVTDEDASMDDISSPEKVAQLEIWDDERIDREAKALLKERRLG